MQLELVPENGLGEGGQIPLTDAGKYAFTLGRQPTHGVYTFGAVDDSRRPVDLSSSSSTARR